MRRVSAGHGSLRGAATLCAALLAASLAGCGASPADGLPGELGPLARDTLGGDVINTDARTPIIEHAIRHGCPYVTGKDMHAGQGEALLGFFAAATRADAAPVAH